MSVKTAQTSETTANSLDLTTRESEVMNLLLGGVIPKEIATNLNISYATVLAHKKNLYRKLDIHNINELLVKYSKVNAAQSEKKENATDETGAFKAVFIQWDTFEDNFGSQINLKSKIEKIKDNYFETYTISGNMSLKSKAYVGVNAFPDASTLNIMRKMKRFSFTVLGDGNTYRVNLTTTETGEDTGFNHYKKDFLTENCVISEINFDIEELSQSLLFGKQVPFVRDHIETFNLQVYSKGDFNLKFWDIKFY